MKKLLLSFAAAAMCTSTFAAVGDVKTILEQTFEEGTILSNGTNYQWGADIQDMITNDGLLMTNGGDAANNYDNRPFLTFPTKSPIGSTTEEVNISYVLYNAKGFGQDPAYFSINYFDGKNNFLFGVKESIGKWEYPATIVTANEDGTTTETPLPVPHMIQGSPETVNLTVKFTDDSAIIEIDGASYSAYSHKAGILAIKLSVSGNKDWNRGMDIQKFEIKTTEIEAVQTAGYTLKYVCGDEVLNTVSKAGLVGTAIAITDADKAAIWNEDKTVKYLFESDDAAGKTIAADGNTVVTLTYRKAATWDYTVKNNVNDNAIKGSCIEGESVTVPYNRYALAADGIVWLKDATDKQYNFPFTPEANNFETTLEYTATEEVGVFFCEAEDLEGMTATSGNNANIRCSNAAAGYAEEAVEVCKLKPGTYKVEIAVWGGKSGADTNITAVVKAGEETVLTGSTTGSWTKYVSEAFTLASETAITFSGAIANQPVDYFLITDATSTAVKNVEAVKGDNKWYNLQGVQVAEPTQPGLYIHNGKKIIVK